MQSGQIRQVETALVAPVVLGKDVLEVLRSETTLGVIGHRVTAVLVLVYVGDMDPEVRVRYPRRQCCVAKINVDDKCCEEG